MQKKVLLSCLLLFLILVARTQFDGFQQKMQICDSIATFDGREKIFVHYDRPQYNLNDTLWLKGYVVAGSLNMINDSSRIAYIEFIDTYGELVKRISAVCDIGLFYSNITLSEQQFSQGVYTIRAYTNYMRNFGDSLFFSGTFKIIDPKAELWKATLNELNFSGNRLFISAALKQGNQVPAANSRVQVALMFKNKALFRRRMVTDAEGNIYIDTLLKDPRYHKNLRLEIINKNIQLRVPVPTANENIDLQFLPEGGSFVAGFKQRLGFKALDIYGMGANVSGVIKDSRGNVVCPFTSVHKGMSVVWMTPQANEIYTAYLENGAAYNLPPVQREGQVLQVSYNDRADSIIVKINVSPGKEGNAWFITGSTRGSFYVQGKLQNRKQYEIKIPAEAFPGGVARFTLYNANGVPVNERALFVWHNDALKINLVSDKEEYVNKDSVMLALSVKKHTNENVPGSFSIAVIDTSQVGMQPDAENIVSYMALSADLKGRVEEPYYYIRNARSEATDALLLTQGWVQYDLLDTARKYRYEKLFQVSGKVTNILNKPSSNTRVTLFGRSGKAGAFFMDTVTNKEGVFIFKDFPLFYTDSVSTLISAVNKREKSFGIGVEVFNKTYPPVHEPVVVYDPNSIVFDTALKKSLDRRTLIMEQLKRDGRYLEEVVVTAKARVPGSKNLNEDGGSDQTITQAVLEKTPKADLLTILGKQIPGFPVVRGAPFSIGKSPIWIIIDGMDLKFFEMNPYDVLQYYSAEDVKGIEIMKSIKYGLPYQSKFNPANIDFLNPPVIVEITTYGGVGPFLKRIPGVYLLKPDAPFVGRKFYSPRYASPDEETVFPDLRQTVYWNSDVITDQNGEARVSFYTTETKGGGYLIIVQGSDLKGSFGTLMAPLKLKHD
ncbi:MAG: hypothetical protein QM594_15765 [Niabella sp.]